MAVTKQRFNCAKDRLRLQHHPVTASERPIVDNAMFVVCERTKIVNYDLDYSLPPRALDDSVVEWTGKKLRKDRQDVKTHKKNQKAKGKRQKAKMKMPWCFSFLTFDFCPLPFAFCLLISPL
jgi:hypothetical protein